MNRHLSLAMLMILFGTGVAVGQGLNIDVEGPWIYYVDDQFKGQGGQPQSALIAMAPHVDNHVVTFSTGDGFVIDEPGVYCVGFDELCAPGHSGSKASFPGKLLRVKAPSGWSWYVNLDKNAIYLILPIPDAYSNDGVYRVKFASKFGKPQNYGPEKKHSIGLLLNYANRPDTINLSNKCTLANADPCPFDGHFQDQENSGTLRISMKAPDDAHDHCDAHVRHAYHKMVLAIHSGSLQNGVNVNQDHGYIDLPDYDPECYKTDPQDDGNLLASAKHMGDQPILDVTLQLNKIIADLGKPELASYNLFLLELVREAKSLRITEDDPSKGKVPFFSQLTHIQLVLRESLKAMDDIVTPDKKAQSALKEARRDEEFLARYAEYIRSASSGKDCRVSQMLIK